MARLDFLPDEILLAIIQHLEFLGDLNSLIATNHRFNALCTDDLYGRIRVYIAQLSQKTNLELLQSQIIRNPALRVIQWCTRHGKTACVRKLIQEEIVPAKLIISTYAMTIAAHHGHIELIKLLLDQLGEEAVQLPGLPERSYQSLSMSGDGTGSACLNPLNTAIKNGRTEVAGLLIDAYNSFGLETSLDCVDSQSVYKAIATHHVSKSLARLLIANGYNPYAASKDSGQEIYESPFTLAAAFDYKAFKLFIDSPVEPPLSMARKIHLRALCFALRHWNAQSVELLIQNGHGLTNNRNYEWRHPWEVASWKTSNVFFHASRSAGMKPGLCDLLMRHIDVPDTIRNNKTWPIIHLLYLAASRNDMNLLKSILKIDWSTKDPPLAKWTFQEMLCKVLHASIQYANLSTVKILIQHGADIDWLPNPAAPRMIQVAGVRGSLDVFEYLLEKQGGMFPNASQVVFEGTILALRKSFSWHGEPIPVNFMTMKDRRKIIKLMLERQLVGDDECQQRHDSFILAISNAGGKLFQFAERHIDLKLNSRSPAHWNAFKQAMRRASLYVVKRFLEQGFDATDALFYFCSEDNRNFKAFGCVHEAIIDAFLKHGAAINAIDPVTNQTPLLKAIMKTSLTAGYGSSHSTRPVEFLIRKGADPSLGSPCPLVTIARLGHLRTVKLLLDFFDCKMPLSQFQELMHRGSCTYMEETDPTIFHW